MFAKLVAIEPIGLVPSAEKKLHEYAEEVIMYDDIPSTNDEIVRRIGNADAVLLSYTTTIGKKVLQETPFLKYVGMCCSLYTPESANVDIHYANTQEITVTGIRDYGDDGVVEYVISQLINCLHGFGSLKPWGGQRREINGLKVGIVGLGKSGGMIADSLNFFGARVSYFARSKKKEAREKGYHFSPLKRLLSDSEVIITCLNKNTVLLGEKEFAHLGTKKLLFNTGLSPAWEEASFKKWINADNRCFCDSLGALGNAKFLTHPHVYCMQISSGRTQQAFHRLSDKVLANLSEYDRRNNIS